ncbi:sensor histidine kinase, partial [Arenibaculum sp.]|uniref:sensor histidine kinase n=1 Tax=Arenibaculum sp. TaxID=2865862 RepID=UPI002E152006|nr:ATP-binding protein [Arenibaculum sp.]
QIVVNLLSNALKFTPEGGAVELSAVPDRGRIAMVVADNGIGIAPEHLSRVFEPFWQEENSLSRRHGGAGLGLPLAKALAELQGGVLRIDSQLGRGTMVTLSLPAQDAAQNAAQNASAPVEAEARSAAFSPSAAS